MVKRKESRSDRIREREEGKRRRGRQRDRETEREGSVSLRLITFLFPFFSSPPSPQQIDTWVATALDPYMFESTLAQVMENQKPSFPDLAVPVILPHLTQLIVNLNGFRTEGIFRIPGDVDLVHQMKLQVESGNFDNFDTKDPRAPSSLLSLWLRELKEPVIPDAKYDECLQTANDPAQCVEVIQSLPSPNKDVIFFLVKFLQTLIAEENQQHTKVLSLSFSPIFFASFLFSKVSKRVGNEV